MSNVMRPVNKGLVLEPHPLSLLGSGRRTGAWRQRALPCCHSKAGQPEGRACPLSGVTSPKFTEGGCVRLVIGDSFPPNLEHLPGHYLILPHSN